MGNVLTEVGRTDAGTTRVGLPRLDAAGLFIQWLAERVTVTVSGYARVSIELYHEPPSGPGVKLTVRWPEGRHVRTWRWEMHRLNRLLEYDGRGELLKEEINQWVEDVQEEMRLCAIG